MAPWVAILLLALLALCAAAGLVLRGAFVADAPGFLWVWDAGLALTAVATLASFVFLGRLRIEIDGAALRVRLGFAPGCALRIPLDAITRAEAVRYEPIREFGGWGIRRGTTAGGPAATPSTFPY